MAYLAKALETGHLDAMTELGDLLAWGVAGTQDLEAAKSWLRKAAEAGHAGARLKLSRMTADPESNVALS